MGAILLFVGSVLGAIGNGLHPRALPGDAPARYFEALAANATWVGDHIGLFFAFLLNVCGLVALGATVTSGPGAVWTRLGAAVAPAAVAASGALTAVDGIAMKHIVSARRPRSRKRTSGCSAC